MSLPHNLKLPRKFKYEVASVSDDALSITINAEIRDIDMCHKWISIYSRLTKSAWIISQSRQYHGRHVCKQLYACYFSKKNARSTKIQFNCRAHIEITVTRDIHLTSTEFPAVISINLHHSYGNENDKATPPFNTTWDFFQSYFHSQMSVEEAMKEYVVSVHEKIKEIEKPMFTMAHIPKLNTVQNWYKLWRIDNLLYATDYKNMMKKLDDTIAVLKKVEAANIKYQENPFALVVTTSLMQRAKLLTSTEDIIYINSTASCELNHHTITFVFAQSAAGAVPLAVIITNGRSISDYLAGFTLLKDNSKTLSPQYIVTDDSDAKRMALSNVFNKSKLLLCSLHILQDVWKWLSDFDKNGILEEDRHILYKLFKNIISSSPRQANIAYIFLKISKVSEKYYNWIIHVEKYWVRREDWCFGYHRKNLRSNPNSVCSQFTVRIFNDFTLKKWKALNIVETVGCICGEMNQYYCDYLKDFAHGRNIMKERLLKPFSDKITFLTKDNIFPIDDSHYTVPVSAHVKTLAFEVDTDFGSCTCVSGYFGNLCSHQINVYSQFHGLEAASWDDRCGIAALVFGEWVLDLDNTELCKLFIEIYEQSQMFTSESYKSLLSEPSPSNSKSLEELSTSKECSELLLSGTLPQTNSESLKQPSSLKFIKRCSTKCNDIDCEALGASHLVYKKLKKYSNASDIDKYIEKLSNVKNSSDMLTFINSFPIPESIVRRQ